MMTVSFSLRGSLEENILSSKKRTIFYRGKEILVFEKGNLCRLRSVDKNIFSLTKKLFAHPLENISSLREDLCGRLCEDFIV